MKRKSAPMLHQIAAVTALIALTSALMWASALTGWTTVASAGTVDEDSASMIGLRGPFAELRTSCVLAILGIQRWCSVATGLATVRYNVVPTAALNIMPSSGFAPFTLNARFRDTGNA